MPIAVPDPQRLLPAAFAADVGAERDPLQFEGGYVWYEVLGITPSRDRPLDEVKDQVEARWREQEIAARLKAKATEVLDKLKAGTPLRRRRRGRSAERADARGDQARRRAASAVRRGRRRDLPHRQGRPRHGRGCAGGRTSRVPVTDVVIPPLDVASEEAKRARETLNRAVTEDIFSEYIARLENELGVTINQSALNQVISGGAVDTN